MYKLRFIVTFFLASISYHSFSQEVYSQKLSVLPPFPKNYFLAVKGILTITDERVLFEANKEKHKKYEFSIPLEEVEKAKKWGAFIIPNPWFLPIMIKVITVDGKKIVLTTSKRRKILSLLNDKCT